MFVSEDGTCIRKITPDGIATIFAGRSDISGYADGVGTKALFGSPQGMVADSLGNLFVIDGGFPDVGTQPSIRKITPQGVVSTIVYGKFLNKPFGITIDKNGVLYISDQGASLIYRMLQTGEVSVLSGSGFMGYVDGPKRYARFNFPAGLAVDDAGNVYVAENPNHVIRKITPDGTVSTFAGTPNSKNVRDPDINNFLVPYDVKISKSGYFYISDYLSIIQISPEGKKTVFASDPALVAGYMTFDECGNIYLADVGSNKINKVTPSGVVSVIAGNGSQSTVDGNVGPFSCQIYPSCQSL